MPQPPPFDSLGGSPQDQSGGPAAGPLSPTFSFAGLISAIQAISVSLQQIVKAIGTSYASLSTANTFAGKQTFALPIQLPVYAKTALPTITLAAIGSIAFCSDGRNTGEGAAAGTGCLVQVQNKSSVATWCATWSGVLVTT